MLYPGGNEASRYPLDTGCASCLFKTLLRGQVDLSKVTHLIPSCTITSDHGGGIESFLRINNLAGVYSARRGVLTALCHPCRRGDRVHGSRRAQGEPRA